MREALTVYEAESTSREESRLADPWLHRTVTLATQRPRLLSLADHVRYELGFGFDADPYSKEFRERALVQHPLLIDAITAGEPEEAAEIAAVHFHLAETSIRVLMDPIEVPEMRSRSPRNPGAKARHTPACGRSLAGTRSEP